MAPSACDHLRNAFFSLRSNFIGPNFELDAGSKSFARELSTIALMFDVRQSLVIDYLPKAKWVVLVRCILATARARLLRDIRAGDNTPNDEQIPESSVNVEDLEPGIASDLETEVQAGLQDLEVNARSVHAFLLAHAARIMFSHADRSTRTRTRRRRKKGCVEDTAEHSEDTRSCGVKGTYSERSHSDAFLSPSSTQPQRKRQGRGRSKPQHTDKEVPVTANTGPNRPTARPKSASQKASIPSPKAPSMQAKPLSSSQKSVLHPPSSKSLTAPTPHPKVTPGTGNLPSGTGNILSGTGHTPVNVISIPSPRPHPEAATLEGFKDQQKLRNSPNMRPSNQGTHQPNNQSKTQFPKDVSPKDVSLKDVSVNKRNHRKKRNRS